MKRLRIPFFIAMGCFLLAGMVTGLRVLYAVFLAQVGLLLCSLALSVWTAYSFTYRQTLKNPNAVKDGYVHLNLSIFNDKPFPLTGMRIHVEGLRPEDEQILDLRLPPHTDKAFELPFFCPLRGNHILGVTTLEISDLFGLLPLKFPLNKMSYYHEQVVTVYPKVYELDRKKDYDANKRAENSLHMNLSADGSLAGTRKYLPGDALKRIHWKASARKRELLTREYEIPEEETCLVLLDTGKRELDQKNREKREDLMCSVTATLLSELLSEGRQCMLSGSEGKPLTASDVNGFEPMHRYLALVPFKSEQSAAITLKTLLKSTQSVRNLFVITDYIENDMQKVLESVSGRGITSLCLCLGNRKLPRESVGLRYVRLPDESALESTLEGIL